MAEIKSEGSPQTDALNGRLTFEQGKNRIVGRDENQVIRLVIDADEDFAVTFYNANGVKISTYDSTGQKFYNSTGGLVSNNDGATLFFYDPNTGNNIMQVGKLPDGTYGWVVSKTGFSVADIYA